MANLISYTCSQKRAGKLLPIRELTGEACIVINNN